MHLLTRHTYWLWGPGEKVLERMMVLPRRNGPGDGAPTRRSLGRTTVGEGAGVSVLVSLSTWRRSQSFEATRIHSVLATKLRLLEQTPQLLPTPIIWALTHRYIWGLCARTAPECWVGPYSSMWLGAYSVPKQAHMSSMWTDVLDFMPSRRLCQPHFDKATPKASSAATKNCRCFPGITQATRKSQSFNSGSRFSTVPLQGAPATDKQTRTPECRALLAYSAFA